MRAHAEACHPRECCGLVVQGQGGLEYVPCRNLAHGDEEFLISPEDWAEAEDMGEIVAVVHSHPGQEPPAPSGADLRAQAIMGIPWIILGTSSAIRVDDLVGRPFVWGTSDCYTLVRDWYFRTRGVELPDWPHELGFWERGGDPFTEHYAEAGFSPVEIQDLVPGDVVLMRVASTVPNHAAVYLGGGRVLHHLMHRTSCIEPLDPWLRRVSGVFRHRSAK